MLRTLLLTIRSSMLMPTESDLFQDGLLKSSISLNHLDHLIINAVIKVTEESA